MHILDRVGPDPVLFDECRCILAELCVEFSVGRNTFDGYVVDKVESLAKVQLTGLAERP